MKKIKIQGMTFILEHSPRGFVSISSAPKADRIAAVYTMDPDTKEKLSNNPVGWSHEMYRLETKAISWARKRMKQKSKGKT